MQFKTFTCALIMLALSAPLTVFGAEIKQRMIYENDLTAVKEALAEGAIIDLFYRDGTNPLLAATRYGNLDMVRLLTGEGADVQVKNQLGWSALIIAARYGYTEIAAFLIENDAYVHTRNHKDFTPLMLAAFGGHQEIVELLINHGVRVDVGNREGKTALYYAALNQREAMVRYLLDHEADIHPFTDDGEALFATAFAFHIRGRRHLAKRNSRLAIADFNEAIGFYERAASELKIMADKLEQRIEGVQKAELARGILVGFLGLVAVHQDLKNINSPNPTNYSAQFDSVLGGYAEAASLRAQSAIEILQIRSEMLRGSAVRSMELKLECEAELAVVKTVINE